MMTNSVPLAARMRPQTIEEYIGQQHLLQPSKPLYEAIVKQRLHSFVLWGPPGVGKTSMAYLLADQTDAQFITLSAVLAGVKDIRAAIDKARQFNGPTILFVDEVHRFNKAQQDAFLPSVEEGVITFIGATTENPSFELNNALLSRVRVYVLKSIEQEEIQRALSLAIASSRGLNDEVSIEQEALEVLAKASQGDLRRAYNLLERCADLSDTAINMNIVREVMANETKRFDKQGDIFYEQISALHKSVRGSDPDASLYWFMRMIEGGCDPLYIARRVVRMASEDIGNADPRALTLAMEAWSVQERLGSPEGELTIAQAIIYLACAPKSNAVSQACTQAKAHCQSEPDFDVPIHLRNAPTQLMKTMGYGKTYRYAHDEPHAYAAGENYFPEELRGTIYYQPTERGLEMKIKEKLNFLKQLDSEK